MDRDSSTVKSILIISAIGVAIVALLLILWPSPDEGSRERGPAPTPSVFEPEARPPSQVAGEEPTIPAARIPSEPGSRGESATGDSYPAEGQARSDRGPDAPRATSWPPGDRTSENERGGPFSRDDRDASPSTAPIRPDPPPRIPAEIAAAVAAHEPGIPAEILEAHRNRSEVPPEIWEALENEPEVPPEIWEALENKPETPPEIQRAMDEAGDRELPAELQPYLDEARRNQSQQE